MFRRGSHDTAGLVLCSNDGTAANGLRIDYLTSSSPMSGCTYGGIVAGQPPSNHASEFEFAMYKRNLAIEVLNFNSEGSVKRVTYTTDGVPQVGNLDPYVRVEAETTNAPSGIEAETCSEGGMTSVRVQS